MLISRSSCEILRKKAASCKETYCRGLFLSARWFVLSQVAADEMNVIVMPDRESAEYCASDLYSLTEGDIVFFLPPSGRGAERSHYKSSLGVQRTTALGKILEYDSTPGRCFIVTYPEALQEDIPTVGKIGEAVLKVSRGDELSFDFIRDARFSKGFEKVDFVSSPGQFSIRGSIIDVFSYSYNYPFRLSFFGDEIENIHSFDCNTQLSREEHESIDIIPALTGEGEGEMTRVSGIIPKNSLIWLDSVDIYKDRPFYGGFEVFRKVFLQVPLGVDPDDAVQFRISPQPVFNKNFELLTADISNKMENGFKVFIYSERNSQIERLKSILVQNGGHVPGFICGPNIHEGFIDGEDRICCYSDHEIFDRFQRVKLRGTVEKSAQLTINDLNSFNIGDYIVHIDHGVGVFGGLVRMKDDKGRVHEVVKLMYKDGDVVFVSVHALNKISVFRSKDRLPPKINKLGSKTWQTLKTSAKSKIKDIAKDLIQLYAKRKASAGFAFSPDGYLQEELES